VDGTTNEGSIYRFNKATGQAERVDVGPPAGAAKSSQKYTVGQTVQRPDGQQARVTAVDENGKPTKFQPL
jgi:hypothetical protein